jgi:hypothetical protein
MKNENKKFIAHGYYVVSNAGGYEVQIDDSGDSARLKLPNGEITEWLPIEYIQDEHSENEGDLMPTIDPQGYNVPLNLVMRIKQF